jgi:hypothetical protein
MRAMKQYDLSRVIAFRALEDFTAMRHRYGTARCRLEIGRSYLDEGLNRDALPVLEEARETFSTCGDRWIEAETAADLARAQRRAGPAKPDEREAAASERDLLAASVQELAVASERYGQTGDVARRADVDRELADVRRELGPVTTW